MNHTYLTRHHLTLPIAFGAILLTTTACHTSQRSTTSSRAELKAESERYEAALQSGLSVESFQSKVTMSMSKSSLKLKGSLKMHQGKDLLLGVNAPLLGFEIARVEATTDSLWIVDKYDKLYVALSIKEVANRIGGDVDLEALQCLLTGRMYIPGRGAASKSDFKRLSWKESGTNLEGSYTSPNRYTLTYTINSDNQLASTAITLSDSTASTFTWSYPTHATSGDYTYPSSEALNASMGASSISATIEVGAPTVPSATWTKFSPTGSYRQVEAKELLETLKKLKQ